MTDLIDYQREAAELRRRVRKAREALRRAPHDASNEDRDKAREAALRALEGKE